MRRLTDAVISLTGQARLRREASSCCALSPMDRDANSESDNPQEMLVLLLPYPFIVLGADELRKWAVRRSERSR